MSLQAPPASFARQVSGQNANDEYILTGLAKRTYRWDRHGRCHLAQESVPLVEEPVFAPEVPGVLLDDTDLYAFKPFTDVVLHGSAYAPKPTSTFQVGLSLGQAQKRIDVVGPRRCEPLRAGLRFSAPEPVDAVQLSYRNAYGGHDQVAEAKRGHHLAELIPFLPEMDLRMASPFVYPRNPAGKGFVMEADREAIEQLELPLLEDPADRLTPEKLCVFQPERWSAMPLPWSTGFLDFGVFPRSAMFGIMPELDPSSLPLAEVRRGFYPASALQPEQRPPFFHHRAANGASPGLQVPYVSPGTEMILAGLHPSIATMRVYLPTETPRILVDGRNGTLLSTQPVIQTIRIYPDKMELAITWQGTASAPRPYLPEELAQMPFKAIWP